MLLETTVTINVKISVQDGKPDRCSPACPYGRADRCALYREQKPSGGRRVIRCVKDTPVKQTPDTPEYAHIRSPHLFTAEQLEDIYAEPTLDSEARRRLALKWRDVRKIRPRSSYTIADTEVLGYGPSEDGGFFVYSL